MKLDLLLQEYRDSLPPAPPIDFSALRRRERVRKARNVTALLALAASLVVWWPAPVKQQRVLPVAHTIATSIPTAPPQLKLAVRHKRKQPRPPSWSGFIALSEAGTLPRSATFQVLRIDVSLDRLTALGIVNAPYQPNSTVTAEVLLGDDGMARAIRIPTTE